MTALTYQDISTKKVAERDALLPKEWLVPDHELPGADVLDVVLFPSTSGHLSPEEVEITETDLKPLAEAIASGKYTSEQVTKAFCHRCVIAQQLTNCLTEVMFEEALADARKLDEEFSKTGKVVGPLHGVPILVKDNINVAGVGSSVGFSGWAFVPETGMPTDAVLVTLLRQLGAVIHCKTNVPPAMMMADTVNHLWGRTTNPLHRGMLAGGLLGGAAALLALKGSPVCVGTDIGGLVRIPGLFQNLWSLRPLLGRFPTYGGRLGLPGLELVNSVNGPLCALLASLEHYCQLVVDTKPWERDAKCVPIPWVPVDLPKKLVFGVVRDDGYVKPTPPVLRAVDEVVAKLKAAGHEVVEWEPTEHLRLSELITEFFLSDGGKHVREYVALAKEPFFADMALYETTKEMGVALLWDLHAERTELVNKYTQRWSDTKATTSTGRPIDALIMPTTPFASVKGGEFRYVGYTLPFNAMDYAAGTFPVTRADKEVDVVDTEYTPRNETDAYVHAGYDPEYTHGGPVGLQVVCKRLEEEKVVAMMKLLEGVVGYEG